MEESAENFVCGIFDFQMCFRKAEMKSVVCHLRALMCSVSVVFIHSMEDDQRLNTLVHEGDTLHFSLQQNRVHFLVPPVIIIFLFVCKSNALSLVVETRHVFVCSGTSLRRTPLGPTKLSIIERVSSGQGFIIHCVGYI